MSNNSLDYEQSVFVDADELYGKEIQPVEVPEKNIGIDTKNEFFENVIDAAENSMLDIGTIESFSQISQNRNLVYNVLDTMCEDSTIAAVLETYTEDATETNNDGRVVWCDSKEDEINKYVTYLLDSLNVDKHIYKWMYSLAKYGDCYLRLFKESDYKMPDFGKNNLEEIERKVLKEQLSGPDDNFDVYKEEQKDEKEKEQLDEAVNIRLYAPDDRFAHYIEMIPNPAEMFELTRFGKTYSYIQAKSLFVNNKQGDDINMYNNAYKYYFRDTDVNMFDATQFVHASLQDNTSRTPEEVDLFLTDKLKQKTDNKIINGNNGNESSTDISMSFKVNRGQSILYNTFKIWRNLTLLENSLLLNRLSKSSIVRVINVEVGDMPKENVRKHLMGIKQTIEQKAALNQGQSLQEYTNPGPIENNIYVPTHNGIGTLSANEIGGDVNPGTLSDIDYFTNKLFGSLKVPKQYLGFTDDSAGFNGGTSLSLISSRYAKTVMRLQNTMIQALTDAINILLLDKGLDSYVNKFQLKMVKPSTQEDKDRQDSKISQIGVVRDLMDLLDDVQDPASRLEILKIMIVSIIDNPEVCNIIDDEIEKLNDTSEPEDEVNVDDNFDDDLGHLNNFHKPEGSLDDINDNDVSSGVEDNVEEPNEVETGETILPTPNELGIDMTDNTLV